VGARARRSAWGLRQGILLTLPMKSIFPSCYTGVTVVAIFELGDDLCCELGEIGDDQGELMGH
jgi:hypothetical protein